MSLSACSTTLPCTTTSTLLSQLLLIIALYLLVFVCGSALLGSTTAAACHLGLILVMLYHPQIPYHTASVLYSTEYLHVSYQSSARDEIHCNGKQ